MYLNVKIFWTRKFEMSSLFVLNTSSGKNDDVQNLSSVICKKLIIWISDDEMSFSNVVVKRGDESDQERTWTKINTWIKISNFPLCTMNDIFRHEPTDERKHFLFCFFWRRLLSIKWITLLHELMPNYKSLDDFVFLVLRLESSGT